MLIIDLGTKNQYVISRPRSKSKIILYTIFYYCNNKKMLFISYALFFKKNEKNVTFIYFNHKS